MPDHDLRQIAIDAMRERGLVPFPSARAEHEAQAARARWKGTAAGVRDMRTLPWFSIDNDDTRDIDQLSVAHGEAHGVTRLLVAIADVDAFVRPGSSADTHAAVNTTSVYTAAGVFPMLPEVLSTDLTSLHEAQERLAMVVDLQVQD